MPSNRWRLSAESVTAASAVLTAAVALAIGVWQTAETRRHNRLSVQPRLVLDEAFSVPDGLNGSAPPDSLRARVTVRNQGLGLADVLGMSVRVSPRRGDEQTYSDWAAAVPAIEGLGVRVGTRATLRGGDLINAGDEVVLLELHNTRPLGVDSLKAISERIGVGLTYRSLYDERFDVSLRE